MESDKGYLVTKFICPLSKPIVVSERLNMKLCNLSESKEFETLRYIVSFNIRDKRFDTEKEGLDELTIKDQFIVDEFNEAIKNFRLYNHGDGISNINEVGKCKNIEELIFYLSKFWVVLEFDFNGPVYTEFNEKEINEWLGIDENIGIDTVALNISYVLTCLSSKEFDFDVYNGESFIIDDVFLSSNWYFWNAEVYKVISTFNFNNSYSVNRYKELENFSFMFKSISDWGEKLDKILNKGSIKKVSYIGGLLKSAANYRLDFRLKFITLVSIIELLLTHNPDYNRFNVEDSISRQFKLKTIMLAKLIDGRTDYANMKKELSEIYLQRSNIAHGNFGQFDKYIREGLKISPDEPIRNFWELTDKLMNYVRIVVSAYVEDVEYVEFIKDN